MGRDSRHEEEHSGTQTCLPQMPCIDQSDQKHLGIIPGTGSSTTCRVCFLAHLNMCIGGLHQVKRMERLLGRHPYLSVSQIQWGRSGCRPGLRALPAPCMPRSSRCKCRCLPYSSRGCHCIQWESCSPSATLPSQARWQLAHRYP